MSNEEREKSISEKKFEKVLGISDKLKQLDDDEETVSGDNKKVLALEERKKLLSEVRGDFENLKKKDDKNYARDVYKQLIEIDMEMLRITRQEMEVSPAAKYVEVAGTLTNSITSAIDSLRDIENTEIDQGFEREKIDIKKSSTSGASKANNVVIVGSISEVLKKLNSEKIVDAEVIEHKNHKVEEKCQ